MPFINRQNKVASDSIAKEHSPQKAALYSAVLPGLGQIYNKKWFKVPIVYGGFVGLGWVVAWNNNKMNQSLQGYLDLNDDDPNTKSYESISSWEYYKDASSSSMIQFSNTLKTSVGSYRRQRDLMLIGTAAFYLLNILDAYVDAHFINFDVGDDLSFELDPALIKNDFEAPVIGATISVTF